MIKAEATTELTARMVKNKEANDAALKRILENLQKQADLLNIKRLEMEITLAERNIETIGYMARSRGEEPKTDDLRAQVTKLKEELKVCETNYELKYGKPKRWWQLWKRAA